MQARLPDDAEALPLNNHVGVCKNKLVRQAGRLNLQLDIDADWPKVGTVLLAAGGSRRFGPKDKLLADVGGEPLLRRAACAAAESGARGIIVVSGAGHQRYEAALHGLPARCVHNADWEKGIGGSIATGVRALDLDADGAFIVPGDMPFLTPELFRGLIAAFVRERARPIVFPAEAGGAQRNPVLWPRRFFPQLSSLNGAEGGKRLLAQAPFDEKIAVTVDDASVLWDVDTEADLARARAFLEHDRF